MKIKITNIPKFNKNCIRNLIFGILLNLHAHVSKYTHLNIKRPKVANFVLSNAFVYFVDNIVGHSRLDLLPCDAVDWFSTSVPGTIVLIIFIRTFLLRFHPRYEVVHTHALFVFSLVAREEVSTLVAKMIAQTRRRV